MTVSLAVIIIDYYTQAREVWAGPEEARKHTLEFMARFEGKMPDKEYQAVKDLVTRLSAL